eukprot:scaffold654541_cov60-Prasinocladus_malaysianus.AAC.2
MYLGLTVQCALGLHQQCSRPIYLSFILAQTVDALLMQRVGRLDGWLHGDSWIDRVDGLDKGGPHMAASGGSGRVLGRLTGGPLVISRFSSQSTKR